MKLLIETTLDYKVLEEENKTTGEKDIFLEGIFMQADVVNRNGRLYPKEVLEKETNRYINEEVDRGLAVGEIGHPKDGSPQKNLDKICCRITELKMDGSDVKGKALILDTDAGKTIKNLVRGGIRLGMSSRALGSLKEQKIEKIGKSVKVVQPDFRLFAIDVVADPSAPDAMVDAIMEEQEWICENGVWTRVEIEQAKQIIDEGHKGFDLNEMSKSKRNAFYHLIRKL